jgi:hypothetical protein
VIVKRNSIKKIKLSCVVKVKVAVVVEDVVEAAVEVRGGLLSPRYYVIP